MKNNPFTSSTFVTLWKKHFLPNGNTEKFDFNKEIEFYDCGFFDLQINAGKNLTKGLSYQNLYAFGPKEKAKTFLVYDVIDTPLNSESIVGQYDIGLYVVRQYPGFKIDLSDYDSTNDYLNGEFKKSSRYKLRKYRKRLEFSFDISFRDYCGAISQSEFDHVFTHFRRLLEKRFSEKRIRNNNLDLKEWAFYKEVSFQMINEGKAALCVIFDGEIPISVTLSYLSDKRVYDAITVFDTDYSKFHLGSVKIMYLVDWCLRKDFNVLDFSKGYFDYKTHWANRRYDFSYHIFFDKNSLKSRLLSYGLKRFFTFKQWLREKQVNEYLHKLRYRFNNKSKDCLRYDFMPVTDELSKYKKESVDLAVVDYYHLKRMCYDFLYLNNEKAKNMKIYRLKEDKNLMLIEGEKSKMALRLSFSR